MNRKLVIRLPGGGRLPIYLMLVWVMIMLWLRDVLGLPSAISYLTDILLVFSFVKGFNRTIREMRRPNLRTQNRIFGMILLAILFGIIINLVNPLLVLWAARNNLRFFVFFYICIGCLSAEDIDQIITMLLRFFWINIVVCTIQHFSSGLSGDSLGGLFGVEEGSNAYMNILLCIVTSTMFGKYFTKKISTFQLGLYVVACMYIAVICELKAFYVEFMIIMLVAMVLGGVSWKYILLGVLSFLGIQILAMILTRYDPHALRVFLDAEALEAYLAGDGYTKRGDLNRFTAIQQINEQFYKGKPLKLLFGYGFGNCEWSQFAALQSSFARQYGYLHYRWFTHAWVFLEQGAVGLSLLLSFLLSLFFTAARRKKQIRLELCIMASSFVVTCIFGMIYNCALQLEACYLIAFVCAVPFIDGKKNEIKSQQEPDALSYGVYAYDGIGERKYHDQEK